MHGINDEGQDAQSDSGSNVTVCVGTETLIADFEFGDVFGPTELDTGVMVVVRFFAGAEVPCAEPGDAEELLAYEVTPDGDSLALVATVTEGEGEAPEAVATLTPFEIPSECVDESEGRIQTLHASGETAELGVTTETVVPDTIAFGESLVVNLPVANYALEVSLGEDTIVGRTEVGVKSSTSTLVFVTGDIDIEGGATPSSPSCTTWRSTPARRTRRATRPRRSTPTPAHRWCRSSRALRSRPRQDSP